MFALGFMLGVGFGFWGAVAWNHWLNLLYEPEPLPDTTQEAADAYIRENRQQPHWRRDGGP